MPVSLAIPHTAQSPTPARGLNQPFALEEVETLLRSLHNGRLAAILGHTPELLR